MATSREEILRGKWSYKDIKDGLKFGAASDAREKKECAAYVDEEKDGRFFASGLGDKLYNQFSWPQQ